LFSDTLETFDNSRGIFSGWRDSALTSKGLAQAQKVAEQLKEYQINYAFSTQKGESLRMVEKRFVSGDPERMA
jgi:broad specificity phosphatase PhoE